MNDSVSLTELLNNVKDAPEPIQVSLLLFILFRSIPFKTYTKAYSLLRSAFK